MKIIKPIDNVRDLSGNDAPFDEYATWAPVGRDFLSDIVDSITGAAGDVLFISKKTASASILVSKVTISTGTIVRDAIATNMIEISEITVSPNAAYVSFFGKKKTGGLTEGVVNIYDTSSFALLYSYTYTNVWGRVIWSPDSSGFLRFDYISSDLGMRFVSSSTWTVSASSATFVSMVGNPLAGVSNCVFSDDSINGYLVLYSRDGVSDSNFSHIVKLTVSTMANTTVSITSSLLAQLGISPTIAYNPAKNEIVSRMFHDTDRFLSKIRAFDDNTLAEKSITISLDASSVSSFMIAPDGTELISNSNSTSPKFRRFDTTAYVEGASLDSVFTAGAKRVIYSDLYYIAELTAGGYAAALQSDDSLITQDNPAVIDGDIYIYGDHVYEALADSTDRPDQGAVLDVPTWLDRGVINSLRMFDGKLDSQTLADESITITITPNTTITGLALFNIKASTVRVVMTDPIDGEVFNSGEVSMFDNGGIDNWFDFFFAPYFAKSDYVTINLPAYPNATIVVTVDGGGSDVAVGELVIGRVLTFGDAQFGTNVGILDFSRKEQDQFGNFDIVKRRFSKRAEYDVKLATRYSSYVQKTLADLRASPVVWIGDETREETIVYGYYRSFDIILSTPSLSDATITVEGL